MSIKAFDLVPAIERVHLMSDKAKTQVNFKKMTKYEEKKTKQIFSIREYDILEYAKFMGLRSQRQLAQSSEKKQSNFLPYQE